LQTTWNNTTPQQFICYLYSQFKDVTQYILEKAEEEKKIHDQPQTCSLHARMHAHHRHTDRQTDRQTDTHTQTLTQINYLTLGDASPSRIIGANLS